MSRMLVVYYSWSNGNTKRIAEQLAGAAGADIARIETVQPYTGCYNEVVEQGHREGNEGYRPPIQPLGVNVTDYDVIAVGTPTWWYTMAPAVLTFLEGQDFSGKTVIPFMTNGGWPGHVIRYMTKACKGPEFACEMAVKFDAQGRGRLETLQAELDVRMERVKEISG